MRLLTIYAVCYIPIDSQVPLLFYDYDRFFYSRFTRPLDFYLWMSVHNPSFVCWPCRVSQAVCEIASDRLIPPNHTIKLEHCSFFSVLPLTLLLMKQVKYWRLKTVQISAVAALLSTFDETVFCLIHVPKRSFGLSTKSTIIESKFV